MSSWISYKTGNLGNLGRSDGRGHKDRIADLDFLLFVLG